MKRIFCLLLTFLLIAALFAGYTDSKPTKILHCDGCGKEVEVDADSGGEEDWIILCEDCKAGLSD